MEYSNLIRNFQEVFFWFTCFDDSLKIQMDYARNPIYSYSIILCTKYIDPYYTIKIMDIYDCLIIGSGSAGATASLYCSRSCLKNMMFTGESWGGLLTTTHIVENYPGCYPAVSGYELMEKMIAQARHYGTIVQNETCSSICKNDVTCSSIYKNEKLFTIKTQNGEYYGRTVIWATGSTPKKLLIPGEKFYENKGLSYCAVCDGFFFKGMDVAVIGGGNSALEEAIFLSRIVNKVHLIHRRDNFRGETILQNEVENNPKIQIHRSYISMAVEGDEEKLTSLKIKNIKSNEEHNIPVQGVFIAIGHQPNTGLIKDLVDLDESGYVKADNTHTKTSGLFVAGDVQDSVYRQAVTAASSGCIAAMEVIKYLRK